MYDILSTIKSREDLVNLDICRQQELCGEIRAFLIDKISRTGGHLASNLGVVELSVALERNLDTSVDRLIWDVGHQSYVHKILTGRADQFDTLRSVGGISGFPKTGESATDAFNTGHSSTSVSAAYGMACSRDLQGKDYKVVCVIGDGAMTGGMAYEALDDLSDYKGQLLIIVNDNGQSISRNKGGLSRSLGRFRVSARYQSRKACLKAALNKNKAGRGLSSFISRLFALSKKLFVKGQFFDALGLKYYGPIDGHDINDLNYMIKNALNIPTPVVLHVHTVKGYGCSFAMEDPDKFHGVGPFDPKTGATPAPSGETWSHAVAEDLCALAEKRRDIVAIVAAMASGTCINVFAERYPDRFFDAAIAEQHAVTVAAGMASTGLVPVVDIYSTFLQRAYDQILHDVCLQNLHVVFLVDRCGVVGRDGETHQGLFDYVFMRPMPNMTILEPADRHSLELCMEYAVNADGPVSVRFPRGNICDGDIGITDVGSAAVVRHGGDVLLMAAGSAAVKAIAVADILAEQGIEARVEVATQVWPIHNVDYRRAGQYRVVAAIENSCLEGGWGQALRAGCRYRDIMCFAYPNIPITHGSPEEVDELYGMSPERIAEAVAARFNET